jgi:hypothetical protein
MLKKGNACRLDAGPGSNEPISAETHKASESRLGSQPRGFAVHILA